MAMKVQTYLCSLTLYISYLRLSAEAAHPEYLTPTTARPLTRQQINTCLRDDSNKDDDIIYTCTGNTGGPVSCKESGKSAMEKETCQYQHTSQDNSNYLVNKMCLPAVLTR